MLGEEIKRKVVIKLEEFSPYAPDQANVGPLLSGQDKLDEVKPIYSYIEETLPQAANEILLVAPLEKLESDNAAHRVCVHPDNKIGTVSLPDDFLRLCRFRMEGWTRAVKVAGHPTSALAYAQDNEWTMGTPQKPVVVLDECIMRYYSVPLVYVPSTDPQAAEGELVPTYIHKIKEFRYIPIFSEVGEYSDNIAELIALNCAKKIYEIFQNIEGVNMMSGEIKTAMEALAL